MFEQEPPPPPRKTRAELMKDIDADYYGYMDDDDGILIPLESKAEKTGMIINCSYRSQSHLLRNICIYNYILIELFYFALLNMSFHTKF